MQKFISTVILALFILSAKAQMLDTTLYQGCKAKNDTTTVIGEPSILDSCPQFKNGFDDLSKFIALHKRYPAHARINHIQGTVIISIIIEKDGSVSHLTAVQGISEDLNNEAIRLLALAPKWQPGILHKVPVRVKYFIPIEFKLPSKKV